MSRAQTATEYLIILAVVIIISLVTISTLTDITGLGGGIDEKTARLTLAAQTIAITEYAVSDYDTLLTLKNNYKNTVTIDTISVNGQRCLFSYDIVHRLASGQTKDIVCQNVYELDDSSVEYSVQINYTDYSTGASFSQSDSEAVLVGDVLDKYMLTLTSNEYWNTSIGGCYDNTTSPIPICTCADLNKTRDNYYSDHQLQNSIDFIRCNNEFGTDFRSGAGWVPIFIYRADFDGNNFAINNLYIDNSSADDRGLFRSVSAYTDGSIHDLILSSAYVVGADDVGIVASEVNPNLFSGANPVLSNVVVSGTVIGTDYVGGLVGRVDDEGIASADAFSSTPVKIESFADVTGEVRVGGLVGYYYSALSSSMRSHGGVSGVSYVGTLFGAYANGFINIPSGLYSSQSNVTSCTTSYCNGGCFTGTQYVCGDAYIAGG